MQELEFILDVACSITRCSTRQAKGRDRQQKCVFARLIFFAIATENGTRDYVAVWHLRRNRSTAYHYKKRVEDLSQFDKEFNVLLSKAREKYARLCKSV
ncbi:MAG: hypothetical protein E7081_02450 [Bacteroidales bacterium]|nr:hypothetical protein [Bacteroidales bacterium]